LPPRVPHALPFPAAAWTAQADLEDAVRREPAANAAVRKRKADRVRRALASGAALAAVLGTDDAERKRAALAADASDPRLAFLLAEAPAWKARGEKTLVFCAHRETLEMLRTALSQRAQLATAAFHEELSSARRDIEVAQFRRPEGASLLVSTECGGEGRNFEFCHRLVLYDLPWNPVVVEQRLGRLDRIGRGRPVDVLYFRPPAGIGAEVVRLFEGLGLFQEPLAGLEAELSGVQPALEEAADRPDGRLEADAFDALVSHARQAMTRIREAAYRELHRDPYRAERAVGILARVPDDLDPLNQAVVTVACDRLGFRVEPQRGRRRFSIEFGNTALVDSLPGVPGGSSFLGTFDREEAVADETLDFFAAGHPLVEAVLMHLEEAPGGRVAALQLELGTDRGLGLAAFYKDGPAFEVIAVDSRGRSRPDWADAVRKRSGGARWRPKDLPEGWAESVRAMVDALPDERRPVALAALVVTPAR
ncbi:MAG: helicase-related protein, partial [Vicinamibacteria bacterium]